ncbi:MAG: SDR family oxidoreductase [Aggregatilineales bacterium]
MTGTAFKENVVLLTGASMGIGEQIAYQLADQGALLMLAARSSDKLAAVANECRRWGAKAEYLAVDLMDEAQCSQLVQRTVATYGRLDTLLYNAGRGYPRRFDELPDLTTIRNEITLNYLGLVACVHYALPHLKQTRGRLVAVSSFGSFVGIPGTAGYNASKHALRGFLNTLRAELLGTDVSVTIVFPGAVSTDRLRETMGKNINRVPIMTPERCAELTVQAAAQRRRQLIMTVPGKLLVALYQWIPALLDAQLARIGKLYEHR